ncbi:MAG: class I SAM-dependent methyltransferase [Planctomycetota bacterium]
MDWYDRAEEYDVLFDWGRENERDFVLEASARWGIADPKRILEPFCGPGVLLRLMPATAVGFDLNPHTVGYAKRTCRVFRGDAARFAVREASFDLAFCLIDSFRHLLTEVAAHNHLRCMAHALEPGAIYVLGFELTGDLPGDVAVDQWSRRRGNLEIEGRFRGLGDEDPVSRLETAHASLAVTRGSRTEQVEDFFPMRLYSRQDFLDLLECEGSFEIAAAFGDRRYEVGSPTAFEEIAGSAVLILRRLHQPQR